MGYTMDGKIHYSPKGSVVEPDAKPIFEKVGITVPPGAYRVYGNCPTLEGMVGGPVLVRENDQFGSWPEWPSPWGKIVNTWFLAKSLTS